MDMKQKIAIAPVVLAMGMLLSGCHTFGIHMNYNCVRFDGTDATGYSCAEWEQSGGIEQPSCFPGNAIVITRSGPKSMNEVQIGEEILGFDHAARQSSFSPVRAWLHRNPEKEVLMKRIEADDVTIVASGMHSLALQGTEDYKFAGDFIVEKDVLMTPDGSGTKVKKTSNEFAKGLFSPLTGTSNFFVADGVGKSVLAHSFAQVSNPRRYERIFHRLVDFGEFFWPGLNDVSSPDYVHPIASILMRLLGISVVEAPMMRRRLQTGSRLEDIVVPFEATPRRLKGGGGGENSEDSDLLIVLSVIEALPPFIGTATSAPHSPVPVALPRTVDVAQWLATGERNNTIFAIITTCLSVCMACCWFFFTLCSGSSSGYDSVSESE